MNKTKSFRRLSVLVLAVLVMTTTILCGTFAKYMGSSDTTSGGITSGKWAVALYGDSSKATTLTLTPDDFEHVRTSTMAPGTTGSFQVVVANEGDVDLTYTLKFKIADDCIFAQNDNIEFYSELSGEKLTKGEDGLYSIEGSEVEYNTVQTTPTTIYWKWAWDNETNESDTSENGTNYSNAEFKVVAYVEAEQVEPTSTTESN